MDTTLAKEMIERADKDNLPENHEMRLAAKEFENASQDLFGSDSERVMSDAIPDPRIKTLLGRWAKARRIYSEYTGQALI